MINILFITPDFYPNSTGFANACVNLIKSINTYGKDKYSVHVFSDVPLNGKPEMVGVNVLRYPKKGKSRFSFFLNEKKKANDVIDYVLRNKIDVIFFETNTFPVFENIIVAKFPNKCVVRFHSTADTEVPIFSKTRSLFAKYNTYLMKSFVKKVDYIIATSSYYLDFVKTHYLNENVYSIWDTKSFDILFNTADIVNADLNPCYKNHFLTMGKMSNNGITQKGITDLLKSIFILKSNNQLPPDFKLTIIGNGVAYPNIASKVNNLGLQLLVNLVKSASHQEVFEYINNSKAIILLSRYEGQSMFITEALSIGKPLIITNRNGMQDMVVNGSNGYLVEPGSPQQAANKILLMMTNSDSVISKMGAMSKDIFTDRYQPSSVFKQFDNIISELLSNNHEL